MRISALFLFVSTAVFAQAPAKNCSIDGSVVNSAGGAPVMRAHVSVATGDDTAFAESDAAGKWSVEHIACGRATVRVDRTGFLRPQRNAGLTPELLLIANTPLHDVKLELAPQSVLAGRVLDDQGDPVLGAQVSLITSRIIGGIRGIQASASAVTNDLGEYRFAGLVAGKYILCANAGGGIIAANGARPYSGKCYPGPMDGGAASAMEVAAGYEGQIDFELSPLATVHVSGVVSGQPEGARAAVSLIPRGQIARMAMGLSAQVRPDGTFVIGNVPPGSYTASATAGPLNVYAHVDVGDSDVEGIQLHVEPGVTVTGTVKVISATGEKIKIDNPRYLVVLRNSDPGIGSGQGTLWDATSLTFTMPDLRAGSYRVDVSPPAPFYVKSVTMGGRDIAASEFTIAPGAANIEVVLSDDGGIVEGDVSTDDGPAAAWVYLERDGAPSRNARSDASGHFKIDTVPPGDYKIYAWDDNTNVEYGNPEWMQLNGKGVAVTVDAGQSAAVKLVRQTAPTE